jgi:hypothetical protein
MKEQFWIEIIGNDKRLLWDWLISDHTGTYLHDKYTT